MTPAETIRVYERRATQAEAVVRAVALLHVQHKKRCEECGDSWPCRTARIVGES